MDNIEAVLENKVSRRKFISGVGAGVGITAAATLAAGCGSSSTPAATTPPPAPAPTITAVSNADILNFALNLEYLEAEFYLRAVTGNGLAAADIGTSPGAVTGGTQVTFATPAIQQYAVEVAGHEQLHVQFLRKTITAIGGTPVDRPQIDFTNAFNAAAVAAKIGPAFNPFDNETDFVLGSFVFEDVGVTAYNGAAPLIVNDANYAAVLAGAGGIVAIEAYHAGLIRYLVNSLGASTIATANLISDLRGAASASVTGTSSGAAETHVSSSSLVAASTDGNSLAFTRNASQVLHVVYLNATAGVVSSGGFFPNGMNGNIKTSLS